MKLRAILAEGAGLGARPCCERRQHGELIGLFGMAHGEVRLREREGALGILALVGEEPPGVLGLGLGVKSNGQDFPLHPIRLRYHGQLHPEFFTPGPPRNINVLSHGAGMCVNFERL